MVSFKVVSLFTKVQIVDSLELLSHQFEDDMLALFKLVLTSTYFCFDGQFYEQIDGVAMGSPLSLVITNFFMENFEKAIEQATHKPVCWFMYVGDTFVIWARGQEKLTEFLNHLNELHNSGIRRRRRRRPLFIPGLRHLQEIGQLPRAQSISETHPYQSLSTP